MYVCAQNPNNGLSLAELGYFYGDEVQKQAALRGEQKGRSIGQFLQGLSRYGSAEVSSRIAERLVDSHGDRKYQKERTGGPWTVQVRWVSFLNVAGVSVSHIQPNKMYEIGSRLTVITNTPKDIYHVMTLLCPIDTATLLVLARKFVTAVAHRKVEVGKGFANGEPGRLAEILDQDNPIEVELDRTINCGAYSKRDWCK